MHVHYACINVITMHTELYKLTKAQGSSMCKELSKPHWRHHPSSGGHTDKWKVRQNRQSIYSNHLPTVYSEGKKENQQRKLITSVIPSLSSGKVKLV